LQNQVVFGFIYVATLALFIATLSINAQRTFCPQKAMQWFDFINQFPFDTAMLVIEPQGISIGWQAS